MGLYDTVKKLFFPQGPEPAGTNKNACKKKRDPLPPASFLVIADLHLFLYEEMMELMDIMETEDYDGVIFLGDIYREDVKKIVGYARGKPCYYVVGNHDRMDQNEGIDGLEDIDGKTVECCGIRISGAGCALRYKSGDWGMRTEEEMEEVMKKLGGTDILVSHESPYHLIYQNQSHGGFRAITKFIKEKEPQIHLFGHYHEPMEKTLYQTEEICVYGYAMVTTNPFRIRYFNHM